MPPRSRNAGNDPEPEETSEVEPENPDPANPGAPPVAEPDEDDDDLDDLDDLDDEAPAGPQRATDDVYVVTSDLVTLKVGPRTNDTIRVGRGKLVKIAGDHKYIDIDYLLRLKAIAPNDGEPKRRTTAAVMAAAAGASDDPVKLPASMLAKDTTVIPAGDATVTSD